MKKIVFFIMVFSLFFVAFDLGNSIYSCPNEKVRLARAVRSKTSKKLQQEMGMIPFGFGGQMMNQIQILMLDFQYAHPVTVEEGRRLLVQAVGEFLKEI